MLLISSLALIWQASCPPWRHDTRIPGPGPRMFACGRLALAPRVSGHARSHPYSVEEGPHLVAGLPQVGDHLRRLRPLALLGPVPQFMARIVCLPFWS